MIIVLGQGDIHVKSNHTEEFAKCCKLVHKYDIH